MKLSELIRIWEKLHIKDTGDIGFCGLADVVEREVGLVNDITPCLQILP